MRRPSSLLPLLLLLLALAWPTSASAQTLVSDGDFSTWVEQLVFNGSWTRETTGGDPGAHLRLQSSASLGSVTLKSGSVTYDPSVSGPLATVRFDADVLGTSGGFTAGQPTFAFALIQAGQIYLAFQAFDTPTWVPISSGELAPGDFTNTLNPGMTPDFSSTGAAFELGVVAASNLSSSGVDVRVDDFVVVATPSSPVPGLTPFGVLALLGAATTTALRAGRVRPREIA